MEGKREIIPLVLYHRFLNLPLDPGFEQGVIRGSGELGRKSAVVSKAKMILFFGKLSYSGIL